MSGTLPDQTFVPTSWACRSQPAASQSCTKAELISVDTGLRMEGVLAPILWDTVIEVWNLHPSHMFLGCWSCTPSRVLFLLFSLLGYAHLQPTMMCDVNTLAQHLVFKNVVISTSMYTGCLSPNMVVELIQQRAVEEVVDVPRPHVQEHLDEMVKGISHERVAERTVLPRRAGWCSESKFKSALRKNWRKHRTPETGSCLERWLGGRLQR